MLRFKPQDQKTFPEEELDDDGCLGPAQVTFGDMSDAMDKAYSKVITGEWTMPAAIAYLRRHAMAQTMQKSFVNHNRNWIHFVQKKKSEKTLIQELGVETFDMIQETGLLPLEKSTNWDRQHPLALHINNLISLSMNWLRKFDGDFLPEVWFRST